MDAIQRVVLPVRRVLLRRTSGGFVPCGFEDSRGSLAIAVDQLGRPVEVVHGDQGDLGYRLAAGATGDSGAIAAWLAAHPQVTAMERRWFQR